jgi:hypothetical protein
VDGVWLHRLAPRGVPGVLANAPAELDGFATAVAYELDRVRPDGEPDVTYGPLSNLALLAVGRVVRGLPIVVGLDERALPELSEGADSGAFSDRHRDALVRELLACAEVIHAESDSVVRGIERSYPGAAHPSRVHVEPIDTHDCDAAAATLESIFRSAARAGSVRASNVTTSDQTAG